MWSPSWWFEWMLSATTRLRVGNHLTTTRFRIGRVQTGFGELRPHSGGVRLRFVGTAIGVPSELRTDQRGHMGCGRGARTGIAQAGAGAAIKNIRDRLGYPLADRVDGFRTQVGQPGNQWFEEIGSSFGDRQLSL